MSNAPQKRKRSDSSSGDSNPSLLSQTAEVSFPRGGASVLTPLEVKEIANEAARDVLFESENAKKASVTGPAKKKRSKGVSTESDAQESTTAEEEKITIDNLNFKTLIPGSIVLGQIKKINRYELILSLADNLSGFVPITSISEELTELLQKYEDQSDDEEEDDTMDIQDEDDNDVTKGTFKAKSEHQFPTLTERFQVGQYLRAIVVDTSKSNTKKQKKRIELSVEPSKVNQGLDADDITAMATVQVSVKSVEDHGAVLNMGIEDLKKSGFISKKELKNGNLTNIEKGSTILLSIEDVTERTIKCKNTAGLPIKKQPISANISSIDAILPGMLIDALIKDVSKTGIACSAYGFCDASINFTHLGVYDSSEIKHKFAIASKVKARVIASYMRNGSKKLQLSVLPHLTTLATLSSSPLEAFPIGHIFDLATIKGRDSNYFYLDINSDSFIGQAHISKITEKADIDMDFKIGSTHKARVLGFSELDNSLLLTLDKKQIEQQFLRVEDIPVGQFVKCEVKKIDEKSLQVKFGENFEAVVPLAHMNDIRLAYPERKFKIGTKINGRVLKIVNNGARSIITVTLKKSLVNMDDEDVISNIDQAEVGKSTLATIEKLQPNGCIVSFFGFLKAFLPNAEISETFVKRPEDHVREGQTVKVRLINVLKDTRRIKVSCRVSDSLSDSQRQSLSTLTPGRSIVNVSIVQKEKDSIIVELTELHLRGVMFAGQLGDGNYEQCRAILKKLQVGSQIEALVLEKDNKSRIVKLTAKPSLIEAAKAETLPLSYKDIIVSSTNTLHGFIKSVTNNGIFVAFANGLTGLVLPRYASEQPIDNLTSAFIQHQSVSCHVIRTDDEKKRFLLSLKSSEGKNDDLSAAINPIDKSIKNLGEYVPGKITKGTVKSVKGTQLNIQLAENQQGRIDVTQLYDSYKDIKDLARPLAKYSVGDVIDVKIIGFHDARNHKFLPISHKKSNKQVILELSAKKSDLKKKSNEVPTPVQITDLKENDEVVAFINNFARGFLWVSVSPSLKGRVSLMDLSNDASSFENLESKYPIGCALKCKITKIDSDAHLLSLSCRDKPITSTKDVSVGDIVPARVVKTRESYVVLELGNDVSAVSFVTDALNDYTQKIDDIFSTNDVCAAKVLEVDNDTNKIYVSLRTDSAKDRSISSVDDLKRGDVVRGFVKNVSDKGVYVALSRNIYALVRVSDLSDSYLKEWKQFYKPHQHVMGKIINAEEEGRILMTLKDSEVNGDLNILKRFEEVEVGEIYEGSVRKATDFGVFVKLDGAINVTGLCHHSEIADKHIDNLQEIFGEGDRVKVKILGVDKEKKQLSLGMKASYFTENAKKSTEDVEMADVDEDKEHDSEDEESSEVASDDEDAIMEDAFEREEESDDDSGDESIYSSSDENAGLSASTGLSTGFDWSANILDNYNNNNSDSEDEDEEETKSKSKKYKKSKNVVEDKTGDLNSRAPQSVSDFERILVGSPNSSETWISYMAFQANLGEIEKAREVAERALKTINYREEQQKLNIWIALLNLESSLGSEETLEDVFKRSCQYMDDFVMHQKLVGIYVDCGENAKAESLFKTMEKKYGAEHPSVWTVHGSFLLDQGKPINEILHRAFQAVSKKHKVEVILKFCLLEFEKGDPEQGRSLFEGLIADSPNRFDIWNVYIDQEIKKGGDKAKVEDLFERIVTSKKLTMKRAKSIFDKWYKFEIKSNDEKSADYVKAKAAEFVQQLQESKAE